MVVVVRGMAERFFIAGQEAQTHASFSLLSRLTSQTLAGGRRRPRRRMGQQGDLRP